MNKLISVIIPVFNREQTIQETMVSVLQQQHRPIELIIVNDGSTDNTKNIVHNFRINHESDEFTICIISQENKGVSAARNNGIKNAKGTYIQFLDSDDLLSSNKLLDELKILEKENLDMVYSKAQYIDEKGNKLDKFWGNSLSHTSYDFFSFSWQPMCPLYTKKSLLKVGNWNENIEIHEDWEYCIRTIVEIKKIKFLPEVKSFYRVHSFGNIGKNFTAEKIRSKEKATTTIYELLERKGLIESKLKRKFLKRYLYCLTQYSIMGEVTKTKKLIKFLKAEDFKYIYILQLLQYPQIGRIIQISHTTLRLLKDK